MPKFFFKFSGSCKTYETLNDNDPIADLQDAGNSTFLPSLTDQNSLQNDFTVLISRVLVENVPAFSMDVTALHIKHAYSENMKQKM